MIRNIYIYKRGFLEEYICYYEVDLYWNHLEKYFIIKVDII